MFKDYSLSIVLPIYNEEENIRDVILEIIMTMSNLNIQNYEIIAVNDGSTDNTFNILNDIKNDKLRIINHNTNLGYGSALNSGFNLSKYPFVFFTDADRQFDIKEIEKFLLIIDLYDIVCGYRFKRADNFNRILISYFYNTLIKHIFGVNLRDIDCAFKLFRKEVLNSIKITSSGFTINLEIISQAGKMGYRIAEVPVSHYKRLHGTSTVTTDKILHTCMKLLEFKINMLAEDYRKRKEHIKEKLKYDPDNSKSLYKFAGFLIAICIIAIAIFML